MGQSTTSRSQAKQKCAAPVFVSGLLNANAFTGVSAKTDDLGTLKMNEFNPE